MKIRSLLAVTLFAAVSASSLIGIIQPVDAKERATKTERSGKGKRMEQMAQRLNLTASQKARLKPIMERSRQNAKAIRNNNQLSEAQKRERMRAVRQNSQKQINAILTDAQRKKLTEMRREKKGNRQKGNGNWKRGNTRNTNFLTGSFQL